MTSMERFMRKVHMEPMSGCWLWAGAMNARGYGTVNLGGKSKCAHRHSYELHVGPIPAGLEIDHLCRTPSCVNPSHLEPVSHQENRLRATRLITHCIHGHAFDEANTLLVTRGPGRVQRFCRACCRDRARVRSALLRLAA